MKPYLIGLQNPHSTDASYALAPYPDRSAGWRLWRMLQELPVNLHNEASVGPAFHKKSYMDAFIRVNLIKVPQDAARLKKRTSELLPALQGRTAILLGHEVLRAFSAQLDGRLKPIFIHPQVLDGVTWRWLYHPSGRCTIYNDPGVRLLAGMMLADVLQQGEDDEQNRQGLDQRAA
jgi:hypothetical protein